jgi:hypothetical protein
MISKNLQTESTHILEKPATKVSDYGSHAQDGSVHMFRDNATSVIYHNISTSTG